MGRGERRRQERARRYIASVQPLFGDRLPSVRIDESKSAERRARALGAAAFTSGRTIGFAPGRLDTGSRHGRRLLAHELTHVLQQQSGRDVPIAHSPPGALEREADHAANRVTANLPVGLITPAPPGIQRATDRQPTAFTEGLAQIEREHPELLALVDTRGAEIVLPFLAGFFSGVSTTTISEADRQRLTEEMTSPLMLPQLYVGSFAGLIEGALNSLWANIVGLAKLGWWLAKNTSVLYNMYRIASEIGRAARGEETETEKLATKVSVVIDAVDLALRAVARELAADPAFFILAADELGQMAGAHVARELESDFIGASGVFDRSRYLGYGVGYVAMEVALLFIGVGEVAAVAKGAAGVARSSAFATRLLEVLSKAKILRPLLKRTGWIDEVADAAVDVQRGAKASAGAAEDIAAHPVRIGGEPHRLRIVKEEGRHVVRLCSDPCASILARIDDAIANGRAAPGELAALRTRVTKLQADLDAGVLNAEQAAAELVKVEAELRAAKKTAFDLARKARERQRKLDEGIAKADTKPIAPADRAWLDANPRHKELAYDPATGSYKIHEAKAALRAEKAGVLDPPVTRAMDEAGIETGLDYFDGRGIGWDHKDWREGVAGVEKLVVGGERILVDFAGASPAQKAALRALDSKYPGMLKFVD